MLWIEVIANTMLFLLIGGFVIAKLSTGMSILNDVVHGQIARVAVRRLERDLNS